MNGPDTQAVDGPRLGPTLRAAALTLLVLSVVTGLLYPALVAGVARLGLSEQADGSLLRRGSTVVGSALIGQEFTEPRCFWPRPSATASFPYNAAASGGSNLGPSNPELLAAVERRAQALRASDPQNRRTLPIDLVTTSASGLDPHISPAAAAWQAARVARARGLDRAAVDRLIRDHTHGRTLGFLGEPRVNVLELNLALDALDRGKQP